MAPKKLLVIVVVFLFYGHLASMAAWPEGEVKNLKDFQYWDNGVKKQCSIYDAHTGRLRGKAFYSHDGTIEKVEKFDELGNKIEAALYDTNGKPRMGIDGWAAMRWKYNGSSLILQVSYDDYGKLIEQKFYSESGKLVMRLYRDDDAVNPYVNAAMYTMLGGQNIGYYDSYGTLREVTRIVKE